MQYLITGGAGFIERHPGGGTSRTEERVSIVHRLEDRFSAAGGRAAEAAPGSGRAYKFRSRKPAEVTAEDSLTELVDACTWPSEAFWRWFELEALRRVEFDQPMLELGCGDGAFTALLGVHVEEGAAVGTTCWCSRRQPQGAAEMSTAWKSSTCAADPRSPGGAHRVPGAGATHASPSSPASCRSTRTGTIRSWSASMTSSIGSPRISSVASPNERSGR